MKIVADANIVQVEQLYRQYGELVLKSGRDIGPGDVCDAQVLVVRSITRVDEALLAGSQVKLVLTATSGTDHLDLAYLRKEGIAVHDAAGSNANAVVEYCLGALAELVVAKGFSLAAKRVGIIGYGHVGSRLYKALSVLGIDCVVCDPFVEKLERLSDKTYPEFVSLQEALSCSIISLHTPLTRGTEYPTYHLINRESLQRIAPGSLLINAARGAVVDNTALYERLRDKADLLCVLDVWENEPNINLDLLALVDIATPHIAGYSVEAKTSASQMNVASLQTFFALAKDAETDSVIEPLLAVTQPVSLLDGDSDEIQLAKCIRAGFAVKEVDAQLRSCGGSCGDSNAARFDSIRKAMTGRREFSKLGFDRSLSDGGMINDAVAQQLTQLGFAFIDKE